LTASIGAREGTALHDITAKRALEVIAQEPLLFPAGERAMYCDSGYFLFGLIIERLQGNPILDYERRQSSPPALQPGVKELAIPSC
jgi:CubicO group peptidase (beta-lactamase class C family)